NPVIYGLVGAAYPALQLIGAPILGRWSDQFGRKRILLLSQAGTLFSWVIFSVALYVPRTMLAEVDSSLLGRFTLTVPLLLVFVARAFDGLTGGNISVANAYVADITSEENRSESFGRLGISSNLGFIIGPALAALLGTTALAEALPVFAALLISLVATLLIAFVLPESNPCALERNPLGKGVSKVFGQEHKDCVQVAESATLRDALNRQHVPLMLALYFVVFLGFNFFYTSFPVHAARQLGWKVTDTGVFFASLSLMMVVVQGPILARLSKRIPEATLIMIGNLMLAANFLLMRAQDTTLIYAAAAMFALGNGLMWPSVLSLLSKAAGERHQGAVQGFAGSLGGLASCAGLVAGGLLYDRAGDLTFAASAGLTCLAAVMSVWLRRRPFGNSAPA
ncbi:MAG: MFS transporter, partial [bacterium]|nr:MFS transporter [bacterium]